MNKDFLKLAEQLNKTEKLTSLAVIEQVKKLTKLTEETRSEFESVISAYNILKKYYEGMPLEKEISKISDTIESNLNNVHEKAEATDKEIKSIVSSVDKLFKEIARVEKMKPKELTQTIIERIQEIPLELSKEKKDELIAETQTEENISKVVEGINNLPITPEQQIDAKHIKNLPDIDGRIRSIGISNKYLAQLLDVDLSGLDYVGGKYVLGSGTGGGGEMFIDQTPDNGTYTLLIGDVDGINTTFTVSQGEYPTGKLVVALNGQILEQGATEDFVETTPASGIFDFVVAPQVGDVVTAFYSTGTGGGGGATAFTDLTDVPSSYTSQALKVVRVNAGETALEFTTLAGGGDALTTDPLSQFASTTSSQLAGVISDETGSGALVFATSPTLVTPTLGAATATTLNTHTIPGGTGTLALTSDITGTNSGTNTGDQDLSGLVPYTGATADLELGTRILNTTGGIRIGSNSSPVFYSDSGYATPVGSFNFASNGVFSLAPGSGSQLLNIDFSAVTGTKTLTAPDATGTIALTSDIPTDADVSETDTGTSTAKYVSPDGLAGSNYGTRGFTILINDSTALTTGDGKAYVRIPEEFNGFDLVGVRFARVSGTGTPLVQVHNVTQAVDMLTTRVSIDSGETDSSTATTAVVIDTANDDVASGDRLRIDVDDAGTSTLWAEVQLVFRLP